MIEARISPRHHRGTSPSGSGERRLFSVRFGPFHLFHGAGTLAAFFNQLVTIELKDCSPSSFYAPEVSLPASQRADLICFGAKDLVKNRTIAPLKL
jgi:hypothetical protein